MQSWFILASSCYLTLAIAHSLLGERMILRPLFAEAWKLRVPRPVAEPLLRGTWHAISLAWAAAAIILAAAARGSEVPTLVLDLLGGLALFGGAAMLIVLRGVHAAWAVLALAGISGLIGAHGWPSDAIGRPLAGAVAATTLLALSALHVYWAVGGRWGVAAVIPTRGDGTRVLRTSIAATLAVAVALAGAAAVVASAAGLIPTLPWQPWDGWARDLGLAAAAGFGLRMIGDFRFAGLFKRERRTEFARWDSMLFSPLCGALCLACAIAAA